MIVDAARYADAARLREPFEPRRDIDPVAEDVPVLHHDVADIHADAKLHATFLVQRVVRRRKLVLDVDRALNRRHGAAERGQNAVAGGSANSSAVGRDETVGDQAKGRQGGQRSLFVHAHQAAIAGDVRGEDGDEPSLERRRFHGLSLISLSTSAPMAPERLNALASRKVAKKEARSGKPASTWPGPRP